MKTVFIACGGTGGHLFPGLAVAQRLKTLGIRVRLIVSQKSIDREILSAHPEFDRSTVEVTGWPGVRPGAIPFAWRLYRSYRQSVQLLSDEIPDAVLGMGGFTCVPVLVAAVRRKTPALIHESNVIPGKATRLLARKVDRVLVGFEQCRGHLPGANVLLTGTPVRAELAGSGEPLDAPDASEKERWGFSGDSVVIAVMGGSQGAASINRLFLDSLSGIGELKDRVGIIHLTGENDLEKVKHSYRGNGWNAKVFAFSHEMGRVLRAADFAVVRSGAATLTECGWFGVPGILVPYPYAAEDHQKANAEAVIEKGGGCLVEEGGDAVRLMTRTLKHWIEDEEIRLKMRRDLNQSTVRDGTGEVVKELMSWIG